MLLKQKVVDALIECLCTIWVLNQCSDIHVLLGHLYDIQVLMQCSGVYIIMQGLGIDVMITF